jgi:hypothetical protein
MPVSGFPEPICRIVAEGKARTRAEFALAMRGSRGSSGADALGSAENRGTVPQ